ncbi:hypothetical protein BLA29_015505 [Euroglyphus maynei]|uniref:Uncharacterized protein n=1 Tax=Euroglyphus maynei TaxID=6958 RepID=A0A1Y3BXX4_EURMA|nr:hypothetical protein BLA29_015505 [Euroglyphus maynei]
MSVDPSYTRPCTFSRLLRQFAVFLSNTTTVNSACHPLVEVPQERED